MAAIDFPASPSTNQTHTASGITWTWDGTSWKAQGSTTTYTLPTASTGTLGGVKVGGNFSIDGAGTLSLSSAAISGLADVTAASSDYLMLWDATDSSLKKVDAGELIGGGGGGGTTNLSNTATGSALTVESSSGNNTDLPAATTSAWGVMTDEDKTNLDANTSKVTNATHTGDVTGSAALTIADDKIEEKHINAGGTVGADKVLVYDAAEATNWKWATQSGSGGGLSSIGIQSGGTQVGSGITQLNFIGTGNTFVVSGILLMLVLVVVGIQ